MSKNNKPDEDTEDSDDKFSGKLDTYVKKNYGELFVKLGGIAGQNKINSEKSLKNIIDEIYTTDLPNPS